MIFFGTLLFVGSVAVPVRTQQLLNQIFAFLIAPVTVLLGYTQQFIGGFRSRNQKILVAGGIRSEYTQRAIGSVLVFLISLTALLCDIDLVVLTLQALEITAPSKDTISLLHLVGVNFSPAELLAVAIIASASAWGIFLLDAIKRTTFLPNFLFDGESILFSRVISVISIIMVLLSLSILIALAFVRWDALNFDPTAIDVTGPVGNDVLFVFIGTTILAFFTSMITFLVAVAFISCIAVFGHSLLLPPVFIFHVVLSIIQQIATLAYNLFLAISNMIAGLTASVRERLHRNRTVVDDAPEGQVDPQNPAEQPAVANPTQTEQLSINNEFGNFVDDKALQLGEVQTVVNLSDFVAGGVPPYNYQLIIENEKVVTGTINKENLLSLNAHSPGLTNASVQVTDSQMNTIEYQFSIQVVMTGNQSNNETKNADNPPSQHENENDAGFNPLDF